MRSLVIAAVAGLLLVLPAVASAATFDVSTTADGDDKECVLDCTLREAVVLASSADTINVPKGVYSLTMGELLLVADHIVGEGARAVIIDGARETRLMRVADGGATVAGVTLRRGNPQNATVSPGFGGAVFVQSGGTLTLTNSTVTDNDAQSGGGIAAAGALGLIGSTVSGNDATTGRLTRGGGIMAASTLVLANTTISGNTALDTPPGQASEGGGVWAGGPFLSQNTTVAGNTASSAGGLFLATPQSGTQQIQNTIIGANTGGSCGGAGLTTDVTRNNIGSDSSCLFTGTADRNSLNPLLGALANNGGNTNTLALAPNSPAIDQGAACAATDQRGVARPQPTGGVCDIGAYEYRAPTLAIVSAVVNDALGPLTPAGMTVHVRQGGADVEGSPAAGLAAPGRPYTLVAGSSYTVDANAISGYTLSYSGDCNVTLAEGDARTCTVTANDIAPTLRVVTAVVNDSGGTRTPAGFTMHVRKGAADVANSPKPGSSGGTTYTLAAGTYSVGADTVTGYTTSVAGACAATGAVTLQVGDAKTCTVTANDNAITRQQSLPPPVPGKNVNALPKAGTVKVKLPGTSTFVVLDEGEQIPLGTIVDVRKGRVTIVAAAGDDQTADFYGGIFKLGQTKGAEPITVVALVEKLSCAKKQASTAAKKKRKRRLWGDGSGRFRTKGRNSAATVLGTKWLVEDRCTSTLTRVVRGRVSVRDFVKKKTVIVKAGKKYVARRRP